MFAAAALVEHLFYGANSQGCAKSNAGPAAPAAAAAIAPALSPATAHAKRKGKGGREEVGIVSFVQQPSTATKDGVIVWRGITKRRMLKGTLGSTIGCGQGVEAVSTRLVRVHRYLASGLGPLHRIMRPVIAVLHDCHSWHVGCALRHSLPAAKHISRNLKRMHVYIHIHTYMYINCNYKTTPNPTYVHTHTRTHSLTLTLTHTLTHTFPCPFRCMLQDYACMRARVACVHIWLACFLVQK